MKNNDGAYIQAYDAQAVVDAEHQVITAADVTTNEQVPPAPRGRLPASLALKERMARKLRTKPDKAAYSRRTAIVEPVFGQVMTCHNLRKIFRHS